MKIGKGYFAKGYGRGKRTAATVYLIDGKAYARDKARYNRVHCDKEGYVNVNMQKLPLSDDYTFIQVWPQDHVLFENNVN